MKIKNASYIPYIQWVRKILSTYNFGRWSLFLGGWGGGFKTTYL